MADGKHYTIGHFCPTVLEKLLQDLNYVSRASGETNLCHFPTLQVMLDIVFGENGLIEAEDKKNLKKKSQPVEKC